MNRALTTARQIFSKEISAIQKTSEALSGEFSAACNEIYSCNGKVVLSGIGKSGLIARKISSTFSSLGIPSIFLDPLDAIHGDFGQLSANDLLLLISNSGSSDELEKIAVYCSTWSGCLTILITSNPNSKLAKLAHIVLKIAYDGEACYMNLAPTSSTTATLVLGDALALCVAEMKEFNITSFSKIHPAGSLGKRLKHVSDIMLTSGLPVLGVDATIKDYVLKISHLHLGAAVVINELPNKNPIGVFTDGDLRRYLINNSDLFGYVKDHMTEMFLHIKPTESVQRALDLMETHKISFLPIIVGEDLLGIVTLNQVL